MSGQGRTSSADEDSDLEGQRTSDEHTEAFDPSELMEMAEASVRKTTPVGLGAVGRKSYPAAPEQLDSNARDQRPTVPPPLPTTDYVAHMMGSVHDSDPYRRHAQAIEERGPETRPFPGLESERRVLSADGPPRAPERREGAPITARGPHGSDRVHQAKTSPPPRGDIESRMRQAEARFAQGDFGTALILGEGLVEEDPGRLTSVRFVEKCRDRLRQMYLTRIGEGAQVPSIAMSPAELKWLPLDHRAGFLLSRIDGYASVDEILDVSGMPSLEALRIMYEFVLEGVIRLRDPD